MYEAGCSYDEIMRSELRHLLMRYQAYEDRKRREELQIIGLRNEIRSLFGEDTIDPYGYSKPRQTAANNEDGLDAFKYRMEKEWDEINIEEDLTKKDVI